MTPVIEPRLEPGEQKPIGHCYCCWDDIYSNKYRYNGVTLCEGCYEHVNDIRTIAIYGNHYPDIFWDYIYECITAGYEPVIQMLKDFRLWTSESSIKPKYDDWVVR